MAAERVSIRARTAACLVLLLAGGAGCTGESSSTQRLEDRPALSVETPAATIRAVADADPAVGQQLFGRIGCNGCHMIDGVGGSVGPDLSTVGARPSRDPARWSSTNAYVRASLEGPGDYVVEGYTPDMPRPDQLGITAADIEHLVAYLLTLRDGR